MKHLNNVRRSWMENGTETMEQAGVEDTVLAQEVWHHTQEFYGAAAAQLVPRWASAFNLQRNDSLINNDEAENNGGT